uniref:Putative monocarboxylate transporter n=1 Tax=Ixodes ricinus TaxID=34613 RepID=V5ICR1_IXORI
MVLGSMFQVAGVFVAYFAPNVYALAASFGFLHGIGAGLVFVLSGTFIQKHFQENRSYVMKLNVTASCAARIAFPRLLLFFRQEYGYPGLLFCFLAAYCSTFPCCAFLLRKPANPKINNTMCTTTSPKVFTIHQPSSSSARSNLRSGEKSMFKIPMFYLTAISHLVFFYTINLHSSIVVDRHYLDKGVPVVTNNHRRSSGDDLRLDWSSSSYLLSTEKGLHKTGQTLVYGRLPRCGRGARSCYPTTTTTAQC